MSLPVLETAHRDSSGLHPVRKAPFDRRAFVPLTCGNDAGFGGKTEKGGVFETNFVKSAAGRQLHNEPE